MARLGVWDEADPYPRPRLDRGKGIPVSSGSAPAVQAPRTFNWAFHIREAGADVRGTVCSRRVAGPAYIDELSIEAAVGSGATRLPVFQLGYSPVAIVEGTGLSGNDIPGVTWLTEHDYSDDGGFADPGMDGFYPGNANASGLGYPIKFGKAIQLAEFFLVASLRTTGASGLIVNGVLRVLENVDAELLADLVIG